MNWVLVDWSSRGPSLCLEGLQRVSRHRPTQPPIQWVPESLSLGVKRPVREADHSPPSNAEVKECVELYFHSPNTSSWRDAQLKKHRDNFILIFMSYVH
jgi:hypothetical protein